MSYRFRFATVNKEYLDKVRSMSVAEFIEFTRINNPNAYSDSPGESVYIHIWEMFKQTEIYDMGDCPYAMDVIRASEPLFTNPETQNYYSESNLYFCDKKAFLAAIDGMRKLVVKSYQRMIDTPALVPLYLDEKKREWSDFTDVMEMDVQDKDKKEKINDMYRPYNLDDTDDEIVKSWRYEYTIFELVRLMKTFDWENNYLIFYGW